MSYDEKCSELAQYFLPAGTVEKRVERLAQRIQDAIESELEVMQDEADGVEK